MKRASTLNPRMPTRWHFGDVVAKLMKSHDPPLTQTELAERSSLNRNTIVNLIDGAFSPMPDTQEKVARALNTTREWILSEVDRFNSSETVVPMRSGKDRQEDKDPALREAMDYARRIVQLEPLTRMAVYSFVATLEQAQERVRRAEEENAQLRERERNSRKL